MCMLAICGMVVQQAGVHLPGAQFTNTDIFGAPGSVGWAGNLQVFLTIGAIEALNFNKHYDGSEPGDLGWGTEYMLGNMNAEEKKYRP